ncbi:magnesium transporter CorA family protein [Nocardioides pantholopis]|uniref:magnesium transporter CorA family protein n=1 Tax=Nocardioides pantholopis TaxID=2483798 RepID=UPI0019CFD901|nr:magnesium transporter CorA family protein [Nocardioides pantholopis]
MTTELACAGGPVTVRLIAAGADDAGAVTELPVDALPALLQRPDGVVWVDVTDPRDPEAGRVLGELLGFHPLAVKDARERNRVPKAHGYADHVFFIIHKPELGERGHVHYVELDLFIGHRFLVTVHGPVNPRVPPGVAVRETSAVLARIRDGRLEPRSPFELAYAVVSTLVRQQEDFLETVTAEVWRLEQQVTSGRLGDPEAFIEELFEARHQLLAVRTMAALAHAICGSVATLPKITEGGGHWVGQMSAEFGRVRSVADGEREYLDGVIDFYQTLLTLRSSLATQQQNEAANRLTEASYAQNEEIKKISAWAAILFAPTLVGTVYGMNFQQMPELGWAWGYPLALLMMLCTSVALHRVFHRTGWL